MNLSSTTSRTALSVDLQAWAQRLGMSRVFVTRYVPGMPRPLRVLRHWHQGNWLLPQTYELSGTPCERVLLNAQTVLVPSELGRHYPRECGVAESYLGIPLVGQERRQALGHVAFLHEEAIDAERMMAIAESDLVSSLHQHVTREWRLYERLDAFKYEWMQHETVLSLAEAMNQPLTAIQGYVQTLAYRESDDAQVVQIRDGIADNVSRASQVLRRFKQLTDISEEEPVRVPVYDGVQRALSSLDTLGWQMSWTGDASVCVDVRETWFLFVLVQVLRNALEAPYDDAADRRLSFRLSADEHHVRLRVDDNARVDNPNHHQWLEAFYGNKQQQSGMGLTMARSILERMGGRIRLDALHPGTRVTMTLPSVDTAA